MSFSKLVSTKERSSLRALSQSLALTCRHEAPAYIRGDPRHKPLRTVFHVKARSNATKQATPFLGWRHHLRPLLLLSPTATHGWLQCFYKLFHVELISHISKRDVSPLCALFPHLLSLLFSASLLHLEPGDWLLEAGAIQLFAYLNILQYSWRNHQVFPQEAR